MRHSAVMVSGCLVGLHCRYDGRSISRPSVLKNAGSEQYIVVCPEQLGGLSTPREMSQIVGGDGEDVLLGKAKVITEKGWDVTKHFLKGAEETLILAQLCNIKKAIFKDKSPSCGVKKIYRGTQLGEGCGVTTALLIREGITVEAVI